MKRVDYALCDLSTPQLEQIFSARMIIHFFSRSHKFLFRNNLIYRVYDFRYVQIVIKPNTESVQAIGKHKTRSKQ